MKTKLLNVILVLSCISNLSAQNVAINIEPTTTLSICGISVLDRSKFFNIASPGVDFEKSINNTYLSNKYLSDLEITFGQNMGLVAQVARTSVVKEDSVRPGYANINYLQNTLKPTDGPQSVLFMSKFPNNVGSCVHEGYNVYPGFMKKEGVAGATDSLPINKVAAAELAVSLLKYWYTDWSRPVTYEPINEPQWQLLAIDKMLPNLADLHLKIWEKAKEAKIPTLIGGPCQSTCSFYSANYQQFLKFANFIDLTQGKLDFYSFHMYDFYYWNNTTKTLTNTISSGLPLEGIMDAMSSWFKTKYNKEFKYICTEHGGQITDVAAADAYAQYNVGTIPGFLYDMQRRSVADFMCVSSAIASTMVFMNHPQSVIKAVPFILPVSTAGNVKYHAAMLMANNYSLGTGWYETDLVNFYKFFKGVKGRRVFSNCINPDIQQQTYVDGKKLIIVMNNLSESAEKLALNYPKSNIDSIMIRRHTRDFNLTSLFSEKFTSDASILDIKGREAVVAFIYYKDNVLENKMINEVPYYAPQMCKEFATSSTFTVNVPSLSNIEYAYLRIGLGRITGTNRNLKVTINGTELTVPMEKCATRLENSAGYGSTKVIPVDKALLTNMNTIICTFDDSKMGGIGAVALLTGVNQDLTKLENVTLLNKLEYEISPNPVNAFATISFTLQQESNTILKIYDSAGKVVKTIKQGRLQSGKHQYEVDTHNLNEGVYLCKLTTGNTNYTKKMLVVR